MSLTTPYYLIDKSKLLANMEKIARLRELSGAKALLALKCFATWSVFDFMRRGANVPIAAWLTNWQMTVENWPDGASTPRLTGPKSDRPPMKRWFTTTAAVYASGGEFVYDDHMTPWSVRAPNLSFALVRADNLQQYVGVASFAKGAVKILSYRPMETEMRLVWMSQLRLRPLCNHPVFDRDGRLVATPDLLDVEAGLFGEYDGDVHLDRRQRSYDIQREAALRDLGLEGVTMIATDRRNIGPYLQRVREARSRARFLPPSERAWTVEPPAWWTPTVTVAQRRALDGWQRARYLRRSA